MVECKLTKKGLLVIHWNRDKGKYEKFISKRPFSHINHVCEVEKGTTLRQIMNLVASDEILEQIVSVYSDVNDIKDFHKEVNKRGKSASDIHHILIQKHAAIHSDKNLEIYCEWTGIKGKNSYSLSFSKLNNLAEKEVKLDYKLSLYNGYEPDPIGTYTTYFTLIEILHAIYYDISFYGGPKERDETLKDLVERVKEIKDQV